MPDKEDYITLSPAQLLNAGIQTGEMRLETIFEEISTSGYINVPQVSRMTITSYLGGYPGPAEKLPGDYVKKGQLLINMTIPELIPMQQAYLKSKHDLSYLKAVYERQQTLAGEHISSQDQLMAAERDFLNMKSDVTALERELRLNHIDPESISINDISPVVSIRAPLDGVISMVNAVNGMYTEAGTPLFEIINTEHMHLEMKVFERDATLVHAGQKIRFSIQSNPGEIFLGSIFLVGKAIDENSRTIEVHAHPDEGKPLPDVLGAFVEASIIIGERQVTGLPEEAVVSSGGKDYVFVLESNENNQMTFKKVEVQLGQTNDSFVEILPSSSALLEGKRIITKGAYGLMQD